MLKNNREAAALQLNEVFMRNKLSTLEVSLYLLFLSNLTSTRW